jgi:hypothetical protein
MTNHQLDQIEKIRARVIESKQINDKLYQDLIQDIGLRQYSLAEEFLFDAVFNSSNEKDYEYFLQQCQDQLKLKS